MIKDYLPSLPLTGDFHIYTKNNRNIMIVTRGFYYIMDFPSFALKQNWRPLEDFGLNRNVKINGVFNTYSGSSFIIYGDSYLVEIDECNMGIKSRRLIKEKFPGIPVDIEKVFKYINGNLYFIRNKT